MHLKLLCGSQYNKDDNAYLLFFANKPSYNISRKDNKLCLIQMIQYTG